MKTAVTGRFPPHWVSDLSMYFRHASNPMDFWNKYFMLCFGLHHDLQNHCVSANWWLCHLIKRPCNKIMSFLYIFLLWCFHHSLLQKWHIIVSTVSNPPPISICGCQIRVLCVWSPTTFSTDAKKKLIEYVNKAKSYSEEKNTETKWRTCSVLCSFSVWQLHS